MIATLTAWQREAAHTRRRDARPGYQPPRVLWLGPIPDAGNGQISAPRVGMLSMLEFEKEERSGDG